ncbi:hypothetical protein KGP36_02435 [Patescibacteria group bacterium]|nr:hypothetical protein [Patescibacteria group bacterium]
MAEVGHEKREGALTMPPVVVCKDIHGRVCLQVHRPDGNTVLYLRHDPSEPLTVKKMREKDFDDRFRPVPDYPAKRCADLYMGYSVHQGATAEAVRYLKTVTSISSSLEEALTARAMGTPPEGGGEEAEDGAPRRAPVPRAGAGTTGSGAFICEKLLEGKLTHEQIVAEVLKRFPGRRTTIKDVRWNLSKLVREGRLQK